MSNQTLSQNQTYLEMRVAQAIQLLNSLGFEVWQTVPTSPLVNQIVGHESLHEMIHTQPETKPDPIAEEIKSTPVLVAHALNHAKQINIYYREDCGFWEDLPEPTVEEAVRDVFGLRAVTPARSSSERQSDNFLSHRSLHERIGTEIRAEVEVEELAAASEASPVETQSQTQETILYPTFKGLSLKNADRVQKDGYLLYVGSRNDCLRAVNQYQKGTAKPNSKNGHSWKFLLTLEDFNSMSSTLTFNFKQFATDAVQSYKAKNEPKQETLWYNLPANPNPSTSYSDDLLEEIATY
ncbi:MAG: hypothetical protein WAQ98_20590 [Blastocatellia bacterium]